MIGTPPQQGLQQTPAAIIATPVAIAASPGGSYARSVLGLKISIMFKTHAAVDSSF